MSNWSGEEIAALKKLVTDGASASAIAKAISAEFHTARTRSAVIGVCFRSGFKLGGINTRNGPVLRHARVARAKQQGGGMSAVTTSKLRRERRVAEAHAGYVEAAFVPADHPHAVAFLEATYGQCRYVLNDPRDGAVCCGDASDGSYCAKHRAVCFVSHAA